MPNILLVGAGLVAQPFVDYMSRRPENHIVIASLTVAKAQDMIKGRPNIKVIRCDVTDQDDIEAHVRECDIVVSLVPYIHHATIIKAAVKYSKNFVSTSYVSPAMLAYDQAAKDAGVIVMNEIGVDPGVDHLYAKKVIDDVHAKGGKVLSFISYCGGLPAPECSNNPLGYKFSWSPRGVLLAAKNEAKYKENGKVVTIAGTDLLRKGAVPVITYPAFAMMGYPNRDSSFYDVRYGMPECHTVLRGSLRYQGNPEIVQAFADTGFLSTDAVDYLSPTAPPLTWQQATARIIGATSNDPEVLKRTVIEKAGLVTELAKERVIRGFSWFGLFSKNPVPMQGTPLDCLCDTMEKMMQYGPGERDMVFLQHRFEIARADGTQYTHTSTLLEYGNPNSYQAMARLVGVPCGVATQLILDGKITRKGVFAPLDKEIYEPLLDILEREEGIRVVDEIVE